MDILTLLAYPPILLGGLVLVFAGFVFPLPGIFILRLNLVPLRFVMMHGALLGGALALWVGISPLLSALGVNSLLVAILVLDRGEGRSGSALSFQGSKVTTFLMVTTIALAFLILYKTQVPAKDTLSLLWGSIYALDLLDLGVFLIIAGGNLFYVLGWHRKIMAILYDPEVAFTSGVNTYLHRGACVVLSCLTVSLGMRILGALLVDAVVLLPALMGMTWGRSLRGSFGWSAMAGGASALGGFVVALTWDIPASSAVALSAVTLFALLWIMGKLSFLLKFRKGDRL